MQIVAIAAGLMPLKNAACMQVAAIDFQALSLAFATCLVPPLKRLNRHRPKAIITVTTFVLLGWMSALGALISFVNMMHLRQQPWFTGGTGKPYKVPQLILNLPTLIQAYTVHLLAPLGAPM